ncbi:MAG: alcohol dehydrogenase catalytic domain-containing protein [Candidatus Omnitrophica bacterium]|nr:alcohol dehydrogenase catalytic domain-containing protein [Candidatus Omnitrophota bacterium]
MRVAVYYNNHDIRLQEMPTPEIGLGELLVKVRASGICGTDVMEWYRMKKAPRILGHEIAGDIVQSNSDRYRVGQRVFVSHHVPCNQCKYCLDGNHTACDTLHQGNYDPGGYSEFVRVPALNVDRGVYVLPDSVSYEEGTFIEPLACVVRGQNIIGIKKGHTVLVLGSGVSGLMNIQLAKLKGAQVIATDIHPYRLQKAKEFGADRVVDAAHDFDFEADRVIVCTGAMKAVVQAFRWIAKKGTILLFAIPEQNIQVPTADFWRHELTLTSTYGAAGRDLDEALELIKDQRVKVNEMITHRLPLEKIQEGFQICLEAKESLKVVLMP